MKKAREDTSSSESCIHFGHYKACAQSILISYSHALKTSLALERGIALTRWSRGLSVMLERCLDARFSQSSKQMHAFLKAMSNSADGTSLRGEGDGGWEKIKSTPEGG